MPSPKELEATRQQDYGDPLNCHTNIAGAWRAYMSQRYASANVMPYIGAHDVAMMMALVKLIRLGHNPMHQDSYDDAITYLTFARRFTCGEEKRSDSDRGKESNSVNQNSDATGDSQSIRGKQDKLGVLRPGLATFSPKNPE